MVATRVRLRGLELIIKPILQTIPSTRDDDFELYAEVLRQTGYNLNVPLSRFLASRKDYPSYEGVTRARRKVQEENPELKGRSKYRDLNEEEYRRYARGELF